MQMNNRINFQNVVFNDSINIIIELCYSEDLLEISSFCKSNILSNITRFLIKVSTKIITPAIAAINISLIDIFDENILNR